MATMGWLSGVAPVDPAKAAAPKEKMPPSDATTQYPDMPPVGLFVTANHSDRRPRLAAKADPVVLTDPLVPCTTRVSTRPPRSPSPFRLVTFTDWRDPIWG